MNCVVIYEANAKLHVLSLPSLFVVDRDQPLNIDIQTAKSLK